MDDKKILERLERVASQNQRIADQLERLVVGSNHAIKTDVIELPPHFYPPQKSLSVDIRALAIIQPAETFEILRYVSDPGAATFFYGYGVFNDALLFDDVEFIPRLDGTRIFQKHGTPIYTAGNPNPRYRISLGLAPDLANTAMIPTQQAVNPGQVLTWTVTNNAAVDVVMGVRMTGYQTQATGVKTGRTSS